jgi:hypothetical protein
LTGSGWGATYLLIKDGDVAGGWLYRLYVVTDDQFLVGGGTIDFELYDRQISHVTWFGTPGGTVPDGGMTLTLLGSALFGLGLLRRKLR